MVILLKADNIEDNPKENNLKKTVNLDNQDNKKSVIIDKKENNKMRSEKMFNEFKHLKK